MEHTNIFIVGIKGVAMCHIAVILKKMGKDVTGADVEEEFITDSVLTENGITSQIGFEPSSLPPKIDLVIYSAAHEGSHNPIVQEAEKRGVSVQSQAAFLGDLLKQFRVVIAVCGTHGKTTTSSLLSYALIKLGAKPSYLIGSSTFGAEGQTFQGGDYNGSDYFVIEADEYGVNPPSDRTPKLHFLHPTNILALNIDFDHPDMYENLDAVKAAFSAFFSQDNATLTYCADDPVLVTAVSTLQTEGAVSFGFSPKSKYKITSHSVRDGKTIYSVKSEDKEVTDIEVSLYGEKNISNATGVVSVLLQLAFTPQQIRTAIKGFKGPKRRLEQKFEQNGTFVFDDYAHHPAEIQATVAALHDRFPGKRIIVVFQPHTFSRTTALLRELTTALALADTALVLPIFASARERAGTTAVTSNDLGNGTTVFAVERKEQLPEVLKKFVKGGEVIVTMGAGDVYKLDTDIINLVKQL